jgi:acetyl-CoA carboxylase biotin carboxyl carrier protein
MSARAHERKATALVRVVSGGRVEVCAPAVGLYRDAPSRGAMVLAGARVGELEILGELVRVDAPDGATGIVVAHGDGAKLARRPVGFGDVLFVVDPNAASGVVHETKQAEVASAFAGLVLRAPSSGRYYARPAPGEAPFVSAGDVVTAGQTIAILEVMKTFNRVTYGGEGLPERARVKRIVPENEADVDAGDVLLELEPA